MKLLNLDQNSPEWEEFRRSHVGASDIPIILGVYPYKKSSQLWEEKVLGKRGYKNEAMQDGHDLEPIARKWAEQTFKRSFPSVTYLHDNGWLMASLDGYEEKTGSYIEIKHPNEKYCRLVEDGIIPEEYQAQMCAQMEVIGQGTCYLVVPKPGWRERKEKGIEWEYQAIVYRRDEKMVEELLRKGKEFYLSMLEFSPPEPLETDFEVREDSEWVEAAQATLRAIESRKLAEEYEEICKDSLKYLAGEKSTKGGGVSVCRYFEKGRVDYSKIPELKCIDLNQYRKGPCEKWRIAAT